MKLYRTFNENLLNLDSSYIEVKGAEFLHLSKSLRIQVDDEVEIFDGKGSSCQAIVKELHKSYLILYLSSAINTETNKSSIISIIPFIKKENLNFLSHKLTELGVDEIHLYKPDLLDQSLQKKDLNKIMDKIDAILINACKQCERNFKPKIFMHNNLSTALKINEDRTLIAFNFSGKTNLNTDMKDIKIGIITGPESGFSENEEIAIKNQSSETYLLGDFPLKAETAAIVAVSLIQHQKGIIVVKQYLFIADSFQELNPKKDTTLFMMRESIKNNVEVFHACIEDILFKDGEVVSRASLVIDIDSLKLDGNKKLIALKSFDRVFMRKEPPVDTDYMNALHLLGLAQEHGARISNNPNAIQNFNEKVFATYFSDLMPKTLITSNIDILKEFYNLHEKIIVKPLDGMGGESIYKIESLEERELLIIDELTNSGTRMIMAQEFVEEIFEGDFRVLIINGIPFKKVLARIPQNGSFKGNLAAGGRGVAKDISNNQLKIANAVSKRLSEHGIDFAGIDIIGNYLTEINITCPTCACEIYDQTGENPIEVYLKENE